ncbi:DUF418 domain-containing protein [Paenibacillus thiaminolyticus]|uniref:DUF418 domain-containing protein n=1 Tax=Paenibacillus thiaminolyticus TaxID=49283 RepID=A0A3A3GI36_PANTH|nr:DUF418 domain-containing protein [Paenibacillus thiaminolyticus]RJG23802.1 DUF418 domain-containing protein [Paenibacillus thiaminolyticus]
MTIYAVQIVFSCVWLRFFSYGALEWLWRMLIYWEVPPLVRKRP